MGWYASSVGMGVDCSPGAGTPAHWQAWSHRTGGIGMSESQLEAAGVPASDAVPVDTGNYPMPEDGPQDDLQQTSTPQYDEDLVDGAGNGAEE
jgi:hypothetical protein